jgi:hypothetical protein
MSVGWRIGRPVGPEILNAAPPRNVEEGAAAASSWLCDRPTACDVVAHRYLISVELFLKFNISRFGGYLGASNGNSNRHGS